ncbi:MAG: DUF1636 domain-containing protein [Pseudomonadota bacterium]
MSTWITVCDTCKREDWESSVAGELTDGERLAEQVEALVAAGGTVRVRRHSCLMGCKRSCNVAIQAAGKIAYTLGEFEPKSDAARAIVDYAQMHAASETGQVPYREWPEAIKGHFVTRHLPLPDET